MSINTESSCVGSTIPSTPGANALKTRARVSAQLASAMAVRVSASKRYICNASATTTPLKASSLRRRRRSLSATPRSARRTVQSKRRPQRYRESGTNSADCDREPSEFGSPLFMTLSGLMPVMLMHYDLGSVFLGSSNEACGVLEGSS